MGDKTMSIGIDILHVVGSDKYQELCNSQGASRMYDVADSIVLGWHVEYCKLTVQRARAINKLISAFNFNNTSRQIECGYVVTSGDVTMTINGVTYSNADFADVCYKLRRLGVKMPLAFNELDKDN